MIATKGESMYRTAVSILVTLGILGGCVTSPSLLQDLGTETSEPTVIGKSTYVGWFGLSNRDKHEVYEAALRDALDKAPAGTTQLRETKLWTKAYKGPVVLSTALTTAIAYLPASSDTIVYAIILGLWGIAASGLEISEYVVTGIPESP